MTLGVKEVHEIRGVVTVPVLSCQEQVMMVTLLTLVPSLVFQNPMTGCKFTSRNGCMHSRRRTHSLQSWRGHARSSRTPLRKRYVQWTEGGGRSYNGNTHNCARATDRQIDSAVIHGSIKRNRV